jgi:hypothetical protein
MFFLSTGPVTADAGGGGPINDGCRARQSSATRATQPNFLPPATQVSLTLMAEIFE